MGRLIDTDDVYETMKMIKDPTVATDVLDHIIATTPTVYDIDRVVDELKFASNKGVFNECDFTGLVGAEKYKGSFVNTQLAIGIVRRGGVNEI